MATTMSNSGNTRPLGEIDGNSNNNNLAVGGTSSSGSANKRAKTTTTTTRGAAAPPQPSSSLSNNKICTFSFDTSPAQLQVLSNNNTVYDLVDIAFRICNPRPYGETASDHLWDLKIVSSNTDDNDDNHDHHEEYFSDEEDEEEDAPANNNKKLKVYSAPPGCPDPWTMQDYDLPASCSMSHIRRADETKIGDLLDSAGVGVISEQPIKLHLKYDYGSTSTHTFTLMGIEEAPTTSGLDIATFPRRKPEEEVAAAAPPHRNNATFSKVNLDEQYKALKEWIFPPPPTASQYYEQEIYLRELNLFKSGRKNHYGYLERDDNGTLQMIYLPDKVESLNHYMDCLLVGANTPKRGHYDWHSIVVLPPNSKKHGKYSRDTEAGFCDCKVATASGGASSAEDLSKIFPNLAAFGGFGNKSKKTMKKKGWIRYKDETLLIVSGGSGGTSACPRAPKGTSYDGLGFHASGYDEVLFRIHKRFDSLQELFCEVESLLQTLL